MVKIENSKRTILNMAEDLLQYKGFNGFSYAHIASELGVKNAAIHYHFPTKEDLSIAVIKRYRDRFQLWINNSRVKDLAPEKKLDWFLSIYNDMRVDQGKVCLVGSMEVEFNTIPEGSGRNEAPHQELAWLGNADRGRDAGSFHFTANLR
jgi:TetR/AcrR family transcriptional repressor of nem operon